MSQALPFHLRMLPPLPTTQASLTLVPVRPLNGAKSPSTTVAHDDPFHRLILPLSPTLQASEAELPNTALKLTPGPVMTGDQVEPVKCRRSPLNDASQTSFAEVPHTDVKPEVGRPVMVLQVAPVVGLWLPFLSYGGTALWLCLACVGLLIAIRRNERPVGF